MTTTTETELPAALDSARSRRWPRVLVAFVLGLGLALVLAAGGVFAYEQAHAGKIGAGVHAGSVDLSGLTREQAAARLTAAYASLSQGQLSLSLPDGASQGQLRRPGPARRCQRNARCRPRRRALGQSVRPSRR